MKSRIISLGLFLSLVATGLSGCTMGPDPQIAAKVIQKAQNKLEVCRFTDLTALENSDDSLISASAWLVEKSCLDNFSDSLKRVEVPEKSKSNLMALISAATDLSNTCKGLARNRSTSGISVHNYYKAGLDVYKQQAPELKSALSAVLSSLKVN